MLNTTTHYLFVIRHYTAGIKLRSSRTIFVMLSKTTPIDPVTGGFEVTMTPLLLSG